MAPGTNIADSNLTQGDPDPYLPLAALANYSGRSVRTLRKALKDPAHPLPHYRLGGNGKILVRRSEFDQWIADYRREGPDLDWLVSEIVKEVAQ